MTTENKSVNPEVLEELAGSLDQINNADVKALRQFESNGWSISLLYGKNGDSPRSTYAVKVTSKLGKHESAVYLYTDFVGKDSKKCKDDMNDFGYLKQGEHEKMVAHAEYLKLSNKYEGADNLDVLLADCNEDVAAYEEIIRDFILENSESITKKSLNDYACNKHKGAWLDTSLYEAKYGKKVCAMVNTDLIEILDVSDTTKLGKIKSQMVRDKFLINKEPKDITLSTGNEKKCSLFRISPDEQ